MIFSRDRILTTHVGSLPRNDKLSDLLVEQENGTLPDAKALSAEMDKAVRHVVQQQMEADAALLAIVADVDAGFQDRKSVV